MNKEIDLRQQIRALLKSVIEEIESQGEALFCASTQFPVIKQRTRGFSHRVTNEFKIEWVCGNLKSGNIKLKFYKMGFTLPNTNDKKKKEWISISREQFESELCKSFNTPKCVVKALDNLDDVSRRLVKYEQQIYKKREKLLQSQSHWVSKLNARLGGAELAGKL